MVGRTEQHQYANDRLRVLRVPGKMVRGVPHDTPIPGYRTNTTNTMRPWAAQAVERFDFSTFNTGDFFGATAGKLDSENISKILCPNDECWVLGPWTSKQKQRALCRPVTCPLNSSILECDLGGRESSRAEQKGSKIVFQGRPSSLTKSVHNKKKITSSGWYRESSSFGYNRLSMGLERPLDAFCCQLRVRFDRIHVRQRRFPGTSNSTPERIAA